ncbi:hypothetical protein D3C80_1461970 [compost metagenome]
MSERRQNADTQSLTLRNAPDPANPLLQCFQRWFGHRQQLAPGSVQTQPPPLPFKQRTTHRLFKLLDLLADSTVGKVHLLGGSAQVL